MITTTKLNGYTITGKLRGTGIYASFDSKLKRCSYNIAISNNTDSVDFVYYMSHNDYINHKRVMDEGDLINAFECILSVALLTLESFCDFMSEFGYTDYKEAKKVYDACKEERDKLLKIGIDADETYELLEMIREDE